MVDPFTTFVASVVVSNILTLAIPYKPELPNDRQFHPAPRSVQKFVVSLFEDVPAPSIAARASENLQCRLDVFENESLDGFPYKGAYFCMVDYGCGQTNGSPVWFDRWGSLWWGPDSAGHLTATLCGMSITDEEKREKLYEESHRGG